MIAPRGVGLCLYRDGAVLAVIHANTYRVLAVADVSWPVAGPAGGARVLAQARRRLGLPRQERVAAVHASERSIVDSTELLVRARLVEAGVIPTHRAARLGSSVDFATNPRFADVSGSRQTVLAVGAALAGLLDYPAPPGRAVAPPARAAAAPPIRAAVGRASVGHASVGRASVAPPAPGIDGPQWGASAWLAPDGPGWLVQRVDGTTEPRVTAATKAW